MMNRMSACYHGTLIKYQKTLPSRVREFVSDTQGRLDLAHGGGSVYFPYVEAIEWTTDNKHFRAPGDLLEQLSSGQHNHRRE